MIFHPVFHCPSPLLVLISNQMQDIYYVCLLERQFLQVKFLIEDWAFIWSGYWQKCGTGIEACTIRNNTSTALQVPTGSPTKLTQTIRDSMDLKSTATSHLYPISIFLEECPETTYPANVTFTYTFSEIRRKSTKVSQTKDNFKSGFYLFTV